MREEILYNIFESWQNIHGSINSNKEISGWISKLNEEIHVDITKIRLDQTDWLYDERMGVIRRENGGFFEITGIKEIRDDGSEISHPIIIQNEIGYLGLICKNIDGTINFLMQAKIEPGNINKIQISPTLQATKSNFTKKHGGNSPPYLKYFQTNKHIVIYDQLQSEQSSRFFKKRNRNMLIFIDDMEEIDILPRYKWMTLGQIKYFMRINNLVNMDTRTVLSGIPFVDLPLRYVQDVKKKITDLALFRSIFYSDKSRYIDVYNKLNDLKMYYKSNVSLISLNSLVKWRFDNGVYCDFSSSFKIIFCDIKIDDREVKQWTQPLFEAIEESIFVLLTCITSEDRREFLVFMKHEIGIFDLFELGPSIQGGSESNLSKYELEIFNKFIKYNKESIVDVYLSEEGGRFFHEQNRNMIVEIRKEELGNLPQNYMWLDYYTLNFLMQHNNILNIQLRNLLSLLEV